MTRLFGVKKDNLNTSHWVSLLHHEISVAGAPNQERLHTWIDDHGITDLVTLQRTDEVSPWVSELAHSHNITWHHFPISGKHMRSPSVLPSLFSLLEWTSHLTKESTSRKIVIHCSAGLHRTGVALYLVGRGTGSSHENTLNLVKEVRSMTASELTRTPKKGLSLAEQALSIFEQWQLSESV